MPDTTVTIRLATVDDARIVAEQRAALFQDVGRLAAHAAPALVEAATAFLEDAMARGIYVGWLAAPDDDPEHIVAGAGVVTRPLMPRPDAGGTGILDGLQGLIVNVYTHPDWRRAGLATRLVREIIAWARTNEIHSLILHASDQGRPVYERLGFEASNEMKFTGLL